MRILHNQSAVSGEHDGASRFLQLRGQTRKNALIYTNTLLPKTDDVVKRIKEYAFEIRVSNFEEWHEGLEDITEEVTRAEKACNFLMHLHDNLQLKVLQQLRISKSHLSRAIKHFLQVPHPKLL